MSFEHPYPDYAYLELDAETNEKRWFSTKGMGVCYVHEDRVMEEIAAAIAAEREACAKIADESTASISINAASAEWDAGWIRHGKEIAAAIRSRGQS